LRPTRSSPPIRTTYRHCTPTRSCGRRIARIGPAHGLFEAVLGELTHHNRPTVVVFEDVHWADESTLDLIRYLGRRLSAIATLMVLTYTDGEVGTQHPLRLVQGNLASSEWVRRLTVPPLSEQRFACSRPPAPSMLRLCIETLAATPSSFLRCSHRLPRRRGRVA
jgi:hypothetical protein